MDPPRHTRRELVTTVGTGLSIAVTGCLGGGNDATPTPDLPFERQIDPSRTYLRTQSDDAGDARPIDLSALGVNAGQSVRLERLGSFAGSSGGTGLTAVFSGSDRLESADVTERVPDAIDAGEDYETSPTYNGEAPTDIPEDFLVADNEGDRTSVTVTVPDGATHLFVAAIDNFYEDNDQGDPPLAVRITSA
ncbi:hypothetical protein [Haloarcula halophila]|uniref:hypothetical protein n=1 Tax=Haloarcula TaxID=2237 RepID=UPI0023E3583D|nr:hypothetical protein [Halomicroarcula sp. DFY41]